MIKQAADIRCSSPGLAQEVAFVVWMLVATMGVLVLVTHGCGEAVPAFGGQ